MPNYYDKCLVVTAIGDCNGTGINVSPYAVDLSKGTELMLETDGSLRATWKQQTEIEGLQNDCKDCAGCIQWLCDCANVKAAACDRIVEQLEKISPEPNPKIYTLEDEYTAAFEMYEKCIAIVKGVQNE